MDRLIGIDMHFIHKKRGHSPETHRLWMERKQILSPLKTRNIGKGKYNERLQEYRKRPKKNRGIKHSDLQSVIILLRNTWDNATERIPTK